MSGSSCPSIGLSTTKVVHAVKGKSDSVAPAGPGYMAVIFPSNGLKKKERQIYWQAQILPLCIRELETWKNARIPRNQLESPSDYIVKPQRAWITCADDLAFGHLEQVPMGGRQFSATQLATLRRGTPNRGHRASLNKTPHRSHRALLAAIVPLSDIDCQAGF